MQFSQLKKARVEMQERTIVVPVFLASALANQFISFETFHA
jgi:hypothetical protein